MITRRAHLAALGLTAAAPLATLGASQARAAAPLELIARRTEITLPKVPEVGLTYIALLDLFDSAEKKVGQASASSFIVALSDAGPVVLSIVVLALEDGEIHYQRQINRYGDYPRTATGAILGGTGEYAGAAGQVEVTWPDEETVEIAIHLS